MTFTRMEETLGTVISFVDEAERDEVWEETDDALPRFEAGDGFEGPCEMIVASAAKPVNGR